MAYCQLELHVDRRVIKDQGSALLLCSLSVGLQSEETALQSYMHLASDVFDSPEV